MQSQFPTSIIHRYMNHIIYLGREMKMKMTRLVLFSVVLVLVLGLVQSASFEYTEDDLKSEEAKWAMYERWRAHHEKPETDDDEKQKRFVIFMDTVKRVDDHNKAKKPYLMELNRMADLTFEEVGRLYTGAKMDQHHRQLASKNSSRLRKVDRHDMPAEFDWRQHNVVNPPKDQSMCGSCWAFGCMGTLESGHAIKTGELVQLSEQQLIDCDLEQGGCNGGVPAYGLRYVATNNGMTTSEFYPYNNPPQRGVCCGAKLKNRVVHCTGFDDVPVDDEQLLMEAVMQQPVSACLYLYPGFFNYKEGIYTGDDCVGTDNLHAVNIVGWGVSPEGCKYWILKNSWGESWGEKGYMRLTRETGDPRGTCYITTQTCFPTFE